MTGTILVLGATGTVGRPLVQALLAAGQPVRAASRSGAPVDGAPGVAFDFADAATHATALDGVDRLFLLAPTGTPDPVAALLPVVEAAAARGIKIVFMSVFGADADEDIPYRRVERAIERAGVPFVILRPNWFADNFHTFWKAGVAQGTIAVPAADGRTSFVDARDIADSAAAVLATDRFDGKAYALTGPEALGYGEAAAVLARTLGKPVAYRAVDDDAFVGILTGAGVPEGYARFLATIFHPVRSGWTAAVSPDVATLTGHPPRSLETYARDNAARLA